MKKLLLFILVFGCCATANAQIVKFSTSISLFQNDTNINHIAEVWKTYLTDASEQTKARLWMGQDVIEYISPHNRMYNDGFQFVYNINRINDNTYEINTISYRFMSRDNLFDYVSNIYKVYAHKVNDEWKLQGYFDEHAHKYKRFETDYITYYFPSDYVFSRKEAKTTSRFIDDFCHNYQIQPLHKVNYVVSNSIDESSQMVGLMYTLWRSDSKYAGRTLYPNTILSARENHFHEIVHALIMPHFPDLHYMMNEGMATYYGGSSNVGYETLFTYFKDWLKENECDFTKFEDLRSLFIQGTYPIVNILGARIIEYSLQKYGYDFVKEMLCISDYMKLFEHLGIAPDGINAFVYNMLT